VVLAAVQDLQTPVAVVLEQLIKVTQAVVIQVISLLALAVAVLM
jgi:hypothetical protein